MTAKKRRRDQVGHAPEPGGMKGWGAARLNSNPRRMGRAPLVDQPHPKRRRGR